MNPSVFTNRVICHPALALAACAVWLGGGRPPAAVAQNVWELMPYRIRVVIAAPAGPQFSPRQRETLAHDLVARTDTLIGAAWELTCVDAPVELRGGILADPDRLTFESLGKLAIGCDKLMLVAIEPSAAGYDVRVCEWDIETQQPGRTVQGSVARSALADGVFRLLVEAFAPLAQIEAVDAKTAHLRFRAAELPPRSEIAWVRPGDIYRPILRTNDRDGHARAIRPLDWTYLDVVEMEGTQALARVHSGLRSALGRRRRGRTEQYALAIKPEIGTTRLLVRSRTQPDRPLTGYDVYAYGPDSKATEHLGRTERDGGIDIPPGQQPIRLLVIKHGDALLARLPIVPGDASQMTALVPDDDRRLEAEGVIVGLQENLVDLVVRRAILASQARSRIAAGKVDEAGQFIDELRRQRTQQQFLRQLEQERQRIISDDPAVQSKIAKLFDDTTRLLSNHLLPREIEELENEWVRARQQAGQPAKAAPPDAPGAPDAGQE